MLAREILLAEHFQYNPIAAQGLRGRGRKILKILEKKILEHPVVSIY